MKKEIKPCLEIKEKIRETAKGTFIKEVYVLPRKIQRRKAKERMKAMGMARINKQPYNVYLREKEDSLVKKNWRKYGTEV